MKKPLLTKEDLDSVIQDAVSIALDAYFRWHEQEVLIPRIRAAQLLGKNVSTLWRWEKSSYLVPVRQGRSVLYRASDLARLGVEIE